jgi:hypothetical protein
VSWNSPGAGQKTMKTADKAAIFQKIFETMTPAHKAGIINIKHISNFPVIRLNCWDIPVT